MQTIQQTISEKFLTKLADGKEVDAIKVEQLRTLMVNDKKPKPDDFVKIFTIPGGGDLQ